MKHKILYIHINILYIRIDCGYNFPVFYIIYSHWNTHIRNMNENIFFNQVCIWMGEHQGRLGWLHGKRQWQWFLHVSCLEHPIVGVAMNRRIIEIKGSSRVIWLNPLHNAGNSYPSALHNPSDACSIPKKCQKFSWIIGRQNCFLISKWRSAFLSPCKKGSQELNWLHLYSTLFSLSQNYCVL